VYMSGNLLYDSSTVHNKKGVLKEPWKEKKKKGGGLDLGKKGKSTSRMDPEKRFRDLEYLFSGQAR